MAVFDRVEEATVILFSSLKRYLELNSINVGFIHSGIDTFRKDYRKIF